eukprot:13578397-Alexandrium_andersonii.AAC.1
MADMPGSEAMPHIREVIDDSNTESRSNRVMSETGRANRFRGPPAEPTRMHRVPVEGQRHRPNPRCASAS